MKIAMASDHAGLELKRTITALLESMGHEVKDFGTHTSDAADLPDFVYPAALAVSSGECERGIFVDGVGYGSAGRPRPAHAAPRTRGSCRSKGGK